MTTKISGIDYDKHFLRTFNLQYLRNAVGKDAVFVEKIKVVDGKKSYDSYPYIQTIQSRMTVESVSYTVDQFYERVTVVMSNGVSIDFMKPFLPVMPQMMYTGGNQCKTLSKHGWFFNKKERLCFLISFEINGCKIEAYVNNEK